MVILTFEYKLEVHKWKLSWGLETLFSVYSFIIITDKTVGLSAWEL